MEPHSLTLAHKPGAVLQLSTYYPAADERGLFGNTLVVFLNGLALPRVGWLPVAAQLLARRQQAELPVPSLLCYDRYGQGESEPDPTDKPDTPYGHDLRAAVNDLHALLNHVSLKEFRVNVTNMRLVLVCSSIGVALARLFATAHPGMVEGLLFLDSMIANSDYLSLIPDSDAPDFDDGVLPSGVSVDDLRYARAITGKVFHPLVPNKEKLDRRNVAELLPDADKPALPLGPDGHPPLLVVVGHDGDAFAAQSEKPPMKIPKAITQSYVNPPWASYNAGLTKLAESGEVKIAKGCGHLIQKDDPAFVAAELSDLLDNILKRRST